MPTTQEENKALVRRGLKEPINSRDIEAIDDLFHSDFVHHTKMREDIEGRNEFKNFVRGLHSAFSDLEFDIEEVVAEGDTVAMRGAFRGDHEGEFQGIEPSGVSVEWSSYGFFRIRDGRISETWILSDVFGLMQQLDVSP